MALDTEESGPPIDVDTLAHVSVRNVLFYISKLSISYVCK